MKSIGRFFAVMYVSIALGSAGFGQVSSQRTGVWVYAWTWAPARTGSITVTSGSNAVTGSSTAFTTEVSVGDTLFTSTGTVIGKVLTVTDDADIVLAANATASYSGAYASGRPPTTTDDATVQNGHTITVSSAGTINCKNLTINSGGAVVSTNIATSPRYLKIYGDLTNNGTYGGSNDGLGVNVNGSSCTISGSGTTYLCRVQPAVATAITFSTNVNMTYTGGSGVADVYCNGFAATFTISASSTLTCAASGYMSVGTSGSNDPGTGAGMTINVYGTLTLPNNQYSNFNLRNTSGNTTTLHVYNGGTINVGNNFVAPSASAATAINVTVDNGGAINFTGTGTCDMSKASPTLNGTVDFGSSSTSTRNLGTATVGSTGLLRLTDGTFPSGTITLSSGSTVEYYGTGSITMPTAPTTYSNLTVTNSNAGGITLGGPITVNGTLTLGTCNVNTTGTNLLTLGPTATVSGYGSSSFVNGPLAATVTGGLTFPVGAGTAYRPVDLGSVLGSSPIINVQVFNGNPGGTPDGSTLSSISTVRYWAIVLASGSFTSGTVNLTYGSDDGVSDNANLNIGTLTAATPNGTYASIGGSGSANGSGNITSSSISSLGGASTPTFFVLGNNMSGTNPLPVEMASFTAAANRLSAELHWSTATETNNYGFEIQRKNSTSDWTKVGFVAGVGTSNSLHKYSYVDNAVEAGLYQYRIKQVDKSGAFKYSASVQVEVGSVPKVLSLGSNYPNPFNPTTSIEFSVPTDGRAALKVYNMLGQQVATLFDGEATAGRLMKVTFDASRLSSGVYFSRLESGGKSLIKRMMLLK